jgi:hypothetical protein
MVTPREPMRQGPCVRPAHESRGTGQSRPAGPRSCQNDAGRPPHAGSAEAVRSGIRGSGDNGPWACTSPASGGPTQHRRVRMKGSRHPFCGPYKRARMGCSKPKLVRRSLRARVDNFELLFASLVVGWIKRRHTRLCAVAFAGEPSRDELELGFRSECCRLVASRLHMG